MIKKFAHIYDKKTLHILITISIFLIGVFLIWSLRTIILGAFLGYILYCILHRFFHTLRTKTKSTSLAITGSMGILLLGLLVFTSVITYIAIDLGGQAQDLWKNTRDIIPETIQASLNAIDFEKIQTYLGDNADAIKNGFQTFANKVGQFISALTLSLVFVVVFLMHPNWIETIGKKIQKQTKYNLKELLIETREILHVWFWQQAKVGGIVAVILCVYLLALQTFTGQDVGNIWIIGALGFFGEFIPLLGPLISWIPIGAISFSMSPVAGGVSVGFFMLLQIIEQYLLLPKIVGTKLNMPATWSIVMLILGGSLFGVLGALLALPLGALIYKKVSKK